MARGIDDIRSDIQGARLSLSEGVEVKEMASYNIEQVETLLIKVPRTKVLAGRQKIETLVLYKDAKRNLKKVYAQQMIKANQQPTLTSAADRKAWADNTPEVDAAEIALIDAEAQLKMAEILHEGYDDLFTAVKKIAAIKLAEEQDVKNADRYGGNL